jgi:hypothetical protein
VSSTSVLVLSLAITHEKQIQVASECHTEYEIRVLRSKALQAITNSRIRNMLAASGMTLVESQPITQEIANE